MALPIKDEIPAWLQGSGEHSDVVLSSRVRLARNLKGYQFSPRITEEQEEQIRQEVLSVLEREKVIPAMTRMDLKDYKPFECNYLLEEHLISNDLLSRRKSAAVVVGEASRVSMMINEEDHLRIQVMHSGLNLPLAWQEVDRIDDLVESAVTYAFHPRLGYLTACPTNVGTGMRVSVMLHLPALVITREIEKVFRSLHKIGLAVRGLYGEGSQAMGDFYQISNQMTLGRSEEWLIKQVGDVVPKIIEYERQARDFLIRESHENLHDRVSRAYGILRTAQTISSEETMHLLSSVRMGINLGLIGDLAIPTVNELFIQTQPAHLQKLSGGELNSADRNIERARFLRRHLNKEQDAGPANN